jgi:Prokaryotic phospholipase A2
MRRALQWAFGVFLVALVACNTQTPPQTSNFTLESIGNLSQDQIEHLSEAQLQEIQAILEPEANRIESELSANTAALNDDPDISAQALWPNYGLTLYYAASVSYGYFMNNVRGRYSGPDWSTDACSNSPDYPLGLNFKDSCIQHDFGYRNVPQYARGRNETVRGMVDGRFYSNLKSVCASVSWFHPILKAKCYVLAYTYYKAVHFFGKGSYYSTRQRYP